MLWCLLVARKENSTGFSTGLTGRSKNLDPTCRSTRPVSISGLNLSEEQALSQDFAKEGAFFKDWFNREQTWPKFLLVLKRIEAIFQLKLGDLPQKKGLRRNPKAFSGRNKKFEGFFWPKTKKKRSSAKSKGFFWPKSEIWGVLLPKTGDFSSHQPALKSRWGTPKSQWGTLNLDVGRVPPVPPTI